MLKKAEQLNEGWKRILANDAKYVFASHFRKRMLLSILHPAFPQADTEAQTPLLPHGRCWSPKAGPGTASD